MVCARVCKSVRVGVFLVCAGLFPLEANAVKTK